MEGHLLPIYRLRRGIVSQIGLPLTNRNATLISLRPAGQRRGETVPRRTARLRWPLSDCPAADCTRSGKASPTQTALYRHDPPSALTFLQQVTAEANDLKPGRISPVASAAIHACHSALALTSALRNPNPSA
jgi:hypothetical protein